MKSHPVIVVTAFSAKDFELAKNLYQWIADLESRSNKHHSCILVCENECPREKRLEIKAIAQESFGFVGVLPVQVKSMFPPNAMFVAASKQIKDTMRLPWLWMEPDCTPLKPDWLNDLSNAYYSQPFRLMGPVIRQANQQGLPSAHLTGTAMYDPDAADIYYGNEKLMKEIVAWDIECASAAVPRTMHTDLIHHHWGENDLPPVFVKTKSEISPANSVTIDFVRPGASLFHRCKDGSLINLLREKYKLPLRITPPAAAAKAVTDAAQRMLDA